MTYDHHAVFPIIKDGITEESLRCMLRHLVYMIKVNKATGNNYYYQITLDGNPVANININGISLFIETEWIMYLYSDSHIKEAADALVGTLLGRDEIDD